MPIVVACPACQKRARVPESMFGRAVKCPACAATFVVSDDGLAVLTPGEPPESDAGSISDAGSTAVDGASDALPLPATPAVPDILRALRAGVFLQLLAQGLTAGGWSIALLITLLGTVAPGALAGPSANPAAGIMALLAGGLMTVSAVLGLVGGAFILQAPKAFLARGLAIANLVLVIVELFQAEGLARGFIVSAQFGMPLRGSSPAGVYSVMLPALSVWAFEAARLTVLALFWRSVSFILRDGTGALLALRLAVATTAAHGLLFLSLILVLAAESGTAGEILAVVGQVAQLGLVVWGVIVAERVWRRLRAVVPPGR